MTATPNPEPLPDLPDFLDTADRLAAQLLEWLRRGYDPATAPPDDVSGVGYIQCRVMCASTDAASVLRMLAEIHAVLPPTITTGPRAGEGRSPGLASGVAAPAVSSERVRHPEQAYHLTAPSPVRAVTADAGDGARLVAAPGHGAGPSFDRSAASPWWSA